MYKVECGRIRFHETLRQEALDAESTIISSRCAPIYAQYKSNGTTGLELGLTLSENDEGRWTLLELYGQERLHREPTNYLNVHPTVRKGQDK
jgi:hypothetical protein